MIIDLAKIQLFEVFVSIIQLVFRLFCAFGCFWNHKIITESLGGSVFYP